MKIVIQATRMYGSSSQYGAEPREAPLGMPIELTDYPLPGERALIYLGAPQLPIFTAIRVGQSIGNVALRGLIGELPNNPEGNAQVLKEEVEKRLAEEYKEVNVWNWYVTIIFEREVDINDEDILDNEYFWLTPEKARELEREFRNYGGPQVDLLSSYLSQILPSQFFERRILTDRVLFLAKDKPCFTLPEFRDGTFGAVAKTIAPMSTLEIGKIRELFATINKDRIIVFSSLPTDKILYFVETADTADLKGKALEELTARLFATVEGFSVARRIQTETEEIDISILNDSNDPRLRREGALIIAECKNWSSKCGKNEFVIFREKVENRNRRCTLGYLISWNGFTETVTKEMLRGSREDTLIVPLTGDDIKLAVRAGDFKSILHQAWEKAVNL